MKEIESYLVKEWSKLCSTKFGNKLFDSMYLDGLLLIINIFGSKDEV